MKSLLDRFVDWIRNDPAAPPFAADVRVDTGFGIRRGAEHIFRPKTPVIVIAFGNGAGVVVVEGEDEVTGLWHRVSYIYSENEALIDRVCITAAIIPHPLNRGTIGSGVDDLQYLPASSRCVVKGVAMEFSDSITITPGAPCRRYY